MMAYCSQLNAFYFRAETNPGFARQYGSLVVLEKFLNLR